ncbi:energy transducer TonB [Neolewinella agarilytica]|uniref:TonB family C-terminal domain-containing protein n=1 Tax=Neolewinella agarilytica TaxID=478744 RepID=A0A1H9CAI3_9BACT|nr:energy transducer TonB [Neolewinella agarilytica]SEP97793.1 TonB family C-terminal domain-containing protein [Neolewinella agarilytica]
MNTLKQTSSTFFLAIALTFSFLLSIDTQAQSTLSTASIAPAILPLQAASAEATPLLHIPEDRDSYEANYPGGAIEVESFLKANVKYPELAQENNFEGTTIVRFKVQPDGSLNDYIVEQSTHAICDRVVIDALKQMGQWTPAKIEGKTVASWRAVAVDFKLGL